MSRAARPRQDGLKPKLIALSVAACFSVSATQCLANPTGGTVVSGSASFNAAGSTLTVTNSANAIINWQSFSIGVNEITRFLQSSSSSAVLNRVTGAGGVIPQSVIDGILSSNGRVFLLNSSGVVIGPSARIDVGGFVASSLNLSNDDFLNGRLHFTEVAGAGGVSNAGVIQAASGGRVFLVAPDVENTGAISAPQGQIVLAAGKSVDLVSESSPFVTVRVTADTEQALNLGKLIADSGRIDMSGALVRQAGIAQANGAVVGQNGEIRLVATQDLTLDAGSTTTANGPSGGSVLLQAQGGTNLISGTVEARGSAGAGGTVQALGVRVGVIGAGVIDASGETGGGTVLVGGDAHGANPDIQNAERTYIGPDGVIRADAATTGDGGRVIVWADGDTRFYGSISARGGAQSGNGGFIETSGKLGLDVQGGRVDARAPNGQWGTWLLDPLNVSIVYGSSGQTGTDPLSGVAGVDTFAGAPVNGSIITTGTIQTAFTSVGTARIQATNDVGFYADLPLTSPYAGLFEVRAQNNINLAADGIAHTITTNGQNVTLSANDVGPTAAVPTLNTTSGTGSIIGGGNIVTDSSGVLGGNITLSGYGVNVGVLETKGGLNANLLQVGNVSITALNGGVQTGNITTRGINGVNTTIVAPTAGGAGGAVSISANGAVAVGNIDTEGGLGGTGGIGVTGAPISGASGGAGGSVGILGTNISTGSITTAGGAGGAGGISSGSGGNGGSAGSLVLGGGTGAPAVPSLSIGPTVTLASASMVSIGGAIDASGGAGGSGGSGGVGGAGGTGGNGGVVDVLAQTVSIASAFGVNVTGGIGGAGAGTTGIIGTDGTINIVGTVVGIGGTGVNPTSNPIIGVGQATSFITALGSRGQIIGDDKKGVAACK
jgi:filamentous hemagglutinin family protein